MYKYILIISNLYETDTYFYYSIRDLLKDFECVNLLEFYQLYENGYDTFSLIKIDKFIYGG